MCALAFGINMPVLLLLVGIIYIVEILSVVLQVSYFKLTHGKRIFKMAPIHHHFEMCGWRENKVCFVFSGVTLIAGILAVLLVVSAYKSVKSGFRTNWDKLCTACRAEGGN